MQESEITIRVWGVPRIVPPAVISRITLHGILYDTCYRTGWPALGGRSAPPGPAARAARERGEEGRGGEGRGRGVCSPGVPPVD